MSEKRAGERKTGKSSPHPSEVSRNVTKREERKNVSKSRGVPERRKKRSLTGKKSGESGFNSAGQKVSQTVSRKEGPCTAMGEKGVECTGNNLSMTQPQGLPRAARGGEARLRRKPCPRKVVIPEGVQHPRRVGNIEGLTVRFLIFSAQEARK